LTIEIGHVLFSRQLQNTRVSTESVFLLLQEVFSSGYRRVEWKYNNLNQASKKAAQRYGFSFEGVFGQAQIVKGHNRDTAWFSMFDTEWLSVCEKFTKWLLPENFEENGNQKRKLNEL